MNALTSPQDPLKLMSLQFGGMWNANFKLAFGILHRHVNLKLAFGIRH